MRSGVNFALLLIRHASKKQVGGGLGKEDRGATVGVRVNLCAKLSLSPSNFLNRTKCPAPRNARGGHWARGWRRATVSFLHRTLLCLSKSCGNFSEAARRVLGSSSRSLEEAPSGHVRDVAVRGALRCQLSFKFGVELGSEVIHAGLSARCASTRNSCRGRHHRRTARVHTAGPIVGRCVQVTAGSTAGPSSGCGGGHGSCDAVQLLVPPCHLLRLLLLQQRVALAFLLHDALPRRDVVERRGDVVGQRQVLRRRAGARVVRLGHALRRRGRLVEELRVLGGVGDEAKLAAADLLLVEGAQLLVDGDETVDELVEDAVRVAQRLQAHVDLCAEVVRLPLRLREAVLELVCVARLRRQLLVACQRVVVLAAHKLVVLRRQRPRHRDPLQLPPRVRGVLRPQLEVRAAQGVLVLAAEVDRELHALALVLAPQHEGGQTLEVAVAQGGEADAAHPVAKLALLLQLHAQVALAQQLVEVAGHERVHGDLFRLLRLLQVDLEVLLAALVLVLQVLRQLAEVPCQQVLRPSVVQTPYRLVVAVRLLVLAPRPLHEAHQLFEVTAVQRPADVRQRNHGHRLSALVCVAQLLAHLRPRLPLREEAAAHALQVQVGEHPPRYAQTPVPLAAHDVAQLVVLHGKLVHRLPQRPLLDAVLEEALRHVVRQLVDLQLALGKVVLDLPCAVPLHAQVGFDLLNPVHRRLLHFLLLRRPVVILLLRADVQNLELLRTSHLTVVQLLQRRVLLAQRVVHAPQEVRQRVLPQLLLHVLPLRRRPAADARRPSAAEPACAARRRRRTCGGTA
eukprot:Rhum_TRINITY_DN23066_c0_g1::Rhum_TRINITY_DN23066_c0_g1_i1::g.177015::m.177015